MSGALMILICIASISLLFAAHNTNIPRRRRRL
jgi:hypothetical protein